MPLAGVIVTMDAAVLFILAITIAVGTTITLDGHITHLHRATILAVPLFPLIHFIGVIGIDLYAI